jgi:hypothetical protein
LLFPNYISTLLHYIGSYGIRTASSAIVSNIINTFAPSEGI